MSEILQSFTSLESALHTLFGSGVEIRRMEPLAGGDINEACRLVFHDGTSIFMKSNAKKPASFFMAEAAGLGAIAQTKTIGTPRVLAAGTDPGRGGYAFLLLEYIEKSRPVLDYWEIFGRELARMHQAPAADFVKGGTYGFMQDNFIGASSQSNRAYDSWTAFFCECRLKPQLKRAAPYFDEDDKKRAGRLLERADSIISEPEYPSLLHGDLWAGNAVTGTDGKALLIDPAAYVGCAEADLAMTELFGGFPQAFYAAYQKTAPLRPGYERRRDFYNLYHLLNHLNLFGRSYLASVRRILEEYGSPAA